MRFFSLVCLLTIQRCNSSGCLPEEEDNVLLVQLESQVDRKSNLMRVSSVSEGDLSSIEHAGIAKHAEGLQSVTNTFPNLHGVLSAAGNSKTWPTSNSQASHPEHRLLMSFLTLHLLAKVGLLVFACAVICVLARLRLARGSSQDQNGTDTIPKSLAPATLAEAPLANHRNNKSFTRNVLARLGVRGCAAGLGKFLKNSRQHMKTSGLREDDQKVPDTAPLSVSAKLSAAPVCLVDGHPNFDGTWTCIRIEGDPDGLLTDWGFGYYDRTVAAAVGFGVNRVKRIYRHKGSHVQLKESGLVSREQEWHITGEEQRCDNQMIKSYWDTLQPYVLVTEIKGLVNTSMRTTMSQYFVHQDTFVLDVNSASGCTGRWVWQRDESSEASGPESSSSDMVNSFDNAGCDESKKLVHSQPQPGHHCP